ncbi:hypothetical protein B0E46_16510 [Rhodanobacter sp. B04]|uniref:hypothetical protein n=1 Tax=Rhodanobacter sp. B04 TaxID=1945860 RepID=UPI000984BD4E|nr:hypothetical protein [Rhodanobacter sp. B04]OOG61563.1 hypothetical protein B0E46_16510 [Rhodanobacter sp. B04]
MYSRQDFIARFRDVETATLLDRLATRELADEAKDAIHQVLHERGVPAEPLNRLRPDIPEHEVAQYAQAIKRGPCPRCHGRESGIEVRESYWVWSALVLTKWQTKRVACCRKCGVRENWNALGFCIGLGWWGIPAGILITPYQIVRNLLAIASRSERAAPSKALLVLAKRNLLAQRQFELERMATNS